jgi:lycopene beta-cyclase
MIRGADVYEAELLGLEQRGVSFYWGCGQVSCDEGSICADGKVFDYDTVIDAAFDASTARSMMWQSFAGVWVTTARESFDPTTALLMDLGGSAKDAPVSFVYVLPVSSREALVEHTVFGPSPLSEERHLLECSHWLEEKIEGDFHLGERERGGIPMGILPRRRAGGLSVGSASGVIRPATGYAFQAIRAQAKGASRSALRRDTDRSRAASVLPRWLEVTDRLFLRALLNAPERGSTLMGGLLARAPSEALIAFLSGDVTMKATLSVCGAVPKFLMIRALLRL